MTITINGTTGIASVDGSAGSPSVRGSDSNSGIVYAADTVSISTGGTERLEVDSAGKIDIPDNGQLRFGTGNDFKFHHDGSGSYIENDTGVISSWSAGNHEFKSSNGNTRALFKNGDACELYFNNTKQFSTHANGPYTESGVGLRCGSSGPVDAELFTVQKNSGQIAYFDHSGGDDHRVLAVRHRGATGSTYRTHVAILDDNADVVGSIRGHGSSTQYNTSSDYRLKENEVLISDGITRLKTLKPYRFNFKKDPATTVDGFFAHEVTAVPEAIAGEKDGKETQGLDYAKLTPLLTAALQEAIAKIETLETKVAALEAA